MCISILICSRYLSVLSVGPGAGFPDHPHRGQSESRDLIVLFERVHDAHYLSEDSDRHLHAGRVCCSWFHYLRPVCGLTETIYSLLSGNSSMKTLLDTVECKRDSNQTDIHFSEHEKLPV
jgi:hypothetical protein